MAKSRTKEIAREKAPQERVKDSYSYEKAYNAAKNSGTPTYHFAVGDRVQVGHLPNCVVEEVMDDGAMYLIRVTTKNNVEYSCWAWTSVRPLDDDKDTHFAKRDSALSRLHYDIGSVHSLASAIMRICATYENLTNFRKVFVERLVISKERMNEIKQYTDGGKKQDEIEFESVTFADGMCMDVRCVPRKDGPSWCEAAIYYADEDVVTSEPYNSFYNHWVCQTANATYHLYMCVADTE